MDTAYYSHQTVIMNGKIIKRPLLDLERTKNIKALKMLNFKIIKKKPILYMTSEDNFIKRIFHKLFHFILPCKAAAHLIMARRFN